MGEKLGHPFRGNKHSDSRDGRGSNKSFLKKAKGTGGHWTRPMRGAQSTKNFTPVIRKKP
jgi:hypothetical protein